MSEQQTEGQPKGNNGLDSNADLFNQSTEGDASGASVSGLESSQTDDADRERASRLGWQDKDAYLKRGGRESAWVPADEFLTFHERVEATRKRENIRLQRELDEAKAERAKMAAEVEELKKFQGEFSKARGEVQEASLLSERRTALENQDYARVNELDSQIMDLRIARKTQPAPVAQPPEAAERERINGILKNFAEENPVFNDTEAQGYLAEEIAVARAANPNLGPEGWLNRARDRVKRLYPELFRAAPARPAMAETRGSPSGQRNGAARSWGDLKPEYREALDKFIKTSEIHSKMPLDKARASILKQADDSSFRTR